jgi:hypothetical protein
MGIMPSRLPASPGMEMANRGLGFLAGGAKAKTGPQGGGLAPAEAGGTVKVKVKEVKVTGGGDPAAVQKALEGEMDKLTRCCQDAAKAGVKLPAEVKVTFSIGPDGKIAGTPKVGPGAADKNLKNCLAAALKGINFPQAQAAVTVSVTLSLMEK